MPPVEAHGVTSELHVARSTGHLNCSHSELELPRHADSCFYFPLQSFGEMADVFH